MKTKERSLCVIIAMALMFSLAPALHGASLDYDFFKGKVITYVVATEPGGGYDTTARLIGKHMRKYIPGANIIIKNTPGAGHIIGANEIFLADPDGLTFGTFSTGLVYSQIAGMKGIRFDLTKYSWIGKSEAEHRVLIVGMKAPFKTIQEIMQSKEPIKMGTSGVGSAAHNETLIMASGLPANLKPIPGYAGREAETGIMRGELAGTIGSYSSLVPFVNAKEARILLQIASQKHPDLRNVPLVSELQLSENGKRLIGVIAATAELGRIVAAPPNMPAGRLGVLREADKKALGDPDLLNDAKKIGLNIDPEFGDEMAKIVEETLHQPEQNLELLRKIIKGS
jgi:tripartite-type tricarboxylate transporter receptor subunit TctC